MRQPGLSFVGTVIDIENPPDDQGDDGLGLSRYRFRIDENINGFDEKEVDIYSGKGGADCSYQFRLGESYFVAPYLEPGASTLPGKTGPAGKLMASICTETQPIASAGALLEELRAPKMGRGATVVGILRMEPGPLNFNYRIPGAILLLRSEGTTLLTRTDPDGVYQFDGVPAGKYQFELKLPPEFPIAAGKAAVLPSITIAGQPCYERDIFAFPPGNNGPP